MNPDVGHDKMKLSYAFAMVAFICSSTLADLITVSSFSDGQGMFSYTFAPGNAQLYYNLGVSGNGGINMRLEGVQSVDLPNGWAYEIVILGNSEGWSDGWYKFRSTEPTFILDSGSVTISIVSIYTNAAEFSGNPNAFDPGDFSIPFCMGVAGGSIVNSDHQIVTGGSENFAFIGPSAVPEPSAVILLVIGGTILTIGKKGKAQPIG